MAPTDHTDNVDGRRLRRSRNRAAVVEAMVALINEGNFSPSAPDIAERAGVSHRSIFRYFDDLDDLSRTSIEHAFIQAERVGRLEDVGTGTLAERIESLVDARLQLFAYIDAPMQVARMKAPTVPTIDATIGLIARGGRVQIARHFAPELDGRCGDEAELLTDAILVATSYDAYTIHRRLLESSQERTRAAFVAALTALLRT
ncbi:MAG: TetR/AcrR family transcriptional regulator [Ilumatobacteraceae bacterium]